jgi:hypothetical protein
MPENGEMRVSGREEQRVVKVMNPAAEDDDCWRW